MTNEAFTIENVVSAIARDLKFDRNDLAVRTAGSQDKPHEPDEHHVVFSRSTDFCVTVHRGLASAETTCRRLISMWLAQGRFFDEMIATQEMLEAVVSAVNVNDLKEWLAVTSRAGWVMEGPTENMASTVTIASLRLARVELLAEYMKDPVSAVLKIKEGDFHETIAVLLEQCSYSTPVMVNAIMKSQGGWEGFTLGMVAATKEGFLVEAENDYTVDYMVALYDSQA